MAAQCEICGGTTIVKELNGYYVCRDCGAAYSVEVMRVMLTGEIVDSKPAPVKQPELLSPAQQLEEDILSCFELGSYTRAAGLLDEYVSEAGEESGAAEHDIAAEIPLGYYYGRLAKSFLLTDAGEKGYKAIPGYLRKYIDEVANQSTDGSDVIQAISKAYIFAASGCVERATSNIELAKEIQEDPEKMSKSYFQLECGEAKERAQELLETNQECCVQGVLGIAYVLASGADADNDMLSVASELRNSLESPAAELPHAKAAANFIDSAVSTNRPESRTLFSRFEDDVEKLTQVGRETWMTGNYDLAYRVFCLTTKSPETSEALFYKALYELLVKQPRGKQEEKEKVGQIVEVLSRRLNDIVDAQCDSMFSNIVATYRESVRSILDYADYLLILFEHKQRNKDRGASAVKQRHRVLASADKDALKVTLHSIANALKADAAPSDDERAEILALCENELCDEDEIVAANIRFIRSKLQQTSVSAPAIVSKPPVGKPVTGQGVQRKVVKPPARPDMTR